MRRQCPLHRHAASERARACRRRGRAGQRDAHGGEPAVGRGRVQSAGHQRQRPLPRGALLPRAKLSPCLCVAQACLCRRTGRAIIVACGTCKERLLHPSKADPHTVSHRRERADALQVVRLQRAPRGQRRRECRRRQQPRRRRHAERRAHEQLRRHELHEPRQRRRGGAARGAREPRQLDARRGRRRGGGEGAAAPVRVLVLRARARRKTRGVACLPASRVMSRALVKHPARAKRPLCQLPLRSSTDEWTRFPARRS